MKRTPFLYLQEYLFRDPVNRGVLRVDPASDGTDLQGFKAGADALERLAKSVRGSLQAGADLGQFAGREVYALLLRISALAHGAELVCHLPDGLGQVGKLASDKGGVLLLRHLRPEF